jgi:hypothetical protein
MAGGAPATGASAAAMKAVTEAPGPNRSVQSYAGPLVPRRGAERQRLARREPTGVTIPALQDARRRWVRTWLALLKA